MNTKKVSKKSIGTLMISLTLIVAIVPSIPATSIHQIQLADEHHTAPTAQQMDITIYGSHYVKEKKPFGNTNGLYVEFVYHGEESIIINASVTLHTRSTMPLSFTYVIGENVTVPAEATGMAAICDLNFGIGFFSFTINIDGCGAFAGQHYEKTARGICVRYHAFVIVQK